MTTRATPEGTKRYAARSTDAGHSVPGHFHACGELTVGSIGLGTYLGDPDETTDALYEAAVSEALALGCNAIDSAINYRYQRSERSIGRALASAFRGGPFARDEVVVSTKGGYVPFDGGPPRSQAEFADYLERTFFAPGVISPSDLACRGQHSMAPRYLEHQLETSLANLGLDSVDVYYIHNPEGQLPEVGREEFDARIRAAFEALERKAADEKLGRYGVATWNGFRVAPSARDYLSLARLVEIARDVGGDGHRFGVVQLPYNLAMPEAYSFANQSVDGEWVSLLDAARELGISVFCSASLMQSRLAGPAPAEISTALGFADGAKSALQFVRSTPGVASALVGMKRVAHVRENLALARVEPGTPESIESLFQE